MAAKVQQQAADSDDSADVQLRRTRQSDEYAVHLPHPGAGTLAL